MIIEANLQQGAFVATILVKEANLTVSDLFKEELFAAIDEGHEFLVVNFASVIYVDSSFLGALVSCLKHAIAQKADVVVAGLNKDILSLFQLIRLDKAFRIFSTPGEAIAGKAK